MSSPITPSPATIRLLSDLTSLQKDPLEGADASPSNTGENIFSWNATIFGPDESEWEGGIFSLRMTFSELYPTKPPKVRFTTPIYHPNVYTDGSLCLDILQDKWSPIYSVSTILTSVQSLLLDPNPDSPANPEAARLYVQDRKAYKQRVRACAAKSADL
eukprot:TRINITY_DN10471_c0_g1_i1.p1 TRINITY_DN10471_c0_g1~~TRINITY_DN10471_c0_g1_i1.p1  ORF type:complete len:159 (+),score=16.82 TRINITY_DN10471_c0_g1_i1:33-509(+)